MLQNRIGGLPRRGSTAARHHGRSSHASLLGLWFHQGAVSQMHTFGPSVPCARPCWPCLGWRAALLPCCLPACLPCCLLPACLPCCLPACLSACLPGCLMVLNLPRPCQCTLRRQDFPGHERASVDEIRPVAGGAKGYLHSIPWGARPPPWFSSACAERQEGR